ncbi:MAG: signal peptidase I [Treponema sp.]|jgi:signal peptidase I|nr:signal peptidase I [Treponema sp.]
MNNRLLHYSHPHKVQTHVRIFFTIFNAIFLFVILNLILTYLIFPVHQSSVSMIPDIEENSMVMVSPFAKKMERGDVVLLKPRKTLQLTKFQRFSDMFVRFFTAQQVSLFEKPNFPGTNSQIRRVVGLPGDRIYMRDYVLYVKPADGKYYLTEFEIAKAPYNVTFFTAPSEWDAYLGVKGSFDEIILADDEYFVLGDNRKSSDDSRLYGPVKMENVIGKVVLCYFPFHKFRLF